MNHIEDDSQDIEISSATDWIRFNNPVQSKSNDPFDIQGEDLLKVSGLLQHFVEKYTEIYKKDFQELMALKHSRTFLHKQLLAMQCLTLLSLLIT